MADLAAGTGPSEQETAHAASNEASLKSAHLPLAGPSAWKEATARLQERLLRLDPREREFSEQTDYSYGAIAASIIEETLSSVRLAAAPDLMDFLWLFRQEGLAAMLRRPILHTRNCQLLEEFPAETDVQRQLIAWALRREAHIGFGHFAEGNSSSAHPCPPLQELLDRIAEDRPFMRRLIDYLEQKNSELESHIRHLRLFQSVSPAGWNTDAGHGSAFLELPGELEFWLSRSKETVRGRLDHPVTFLHVEDSRTSIWTWVFDRQIGFIPYTKAEYRDDLGHFDGKHYPDAESALQDLASRTPWPEVILTDIELGSGKNGIEFVQALHRLREQIEPAPAEPRIFVYSSNIPGFQSSLDALRRADLIEEYFPKQSFSSDLFVARLNTQA